MMAKQEIRIDVSSILKSEIGTSQTLPVKANIEKISDSDFKIVDDLEGTMAIEHIAEKELLVLFNLKTTIEFTCARCLDKFRTPMELNYKERFGSSSEAEGFIITNNKTIDILPSIRQEILLSIPIKPLCRKSCKGIKI